MQILIKQADTLHKSSHEIVVLIAYTVKPVLSGHSKRKPNMCFKTDYRLMKLPFVIKICVLSIFEWLL